MLPIIGFSQQTASDTMLVGAFDEVTIQATRLSISKDRIPFDITLLDKRALSRATNLLSPYEALSTTPGLFVANGENFAQDLRVAIRGFGGRSSFGIRGIKVILDGVPETTPDGQTDIDNIDMGLIDNASIIHTNQSALYGNSSNGLIYLESDDFRGRDSSLQVGLARGGFGLLRLQAKGVYSNDKWGLLFGANHQRYDGFRQNSEMISSLFTGRVRRKVKTGYVELAGNVVNSPIANDAGSITLEQSEEDRTQVREAIINLKAGEALDQWRLALKNKHSLGNGFTLDHIAYFVNRNFETRLPFVNSAFVEFERSFVGSGLKLSYKKSLKEWEFNSTLGHDYENQKDHRKRFDNLVGDRGTLRLDQDEKYSTNAVYHSSHLTWDGKLDLNYAVRFENTTIGVFDYFAGATEDLEKNYTPFTYNLGIGYFPVRQVKLWYNYSKGFDTPSLNELSNNPNGTGFNDLSPQFSKNHEVGVSLLSDLGFETKITMYNSEVDNELVPYALADQPGRTFYQNAGETNRRGLEVQVSYETTRTNFQIGVDAAKYRFIDFEENGNSFNGNTIPGLPQLSWFGQFDLDLGSSVRFGTTYRRIGGMFVNNANTLETKPFHVLTAKISGQVSVKGLLIKPYLSGQNLLNTEYFANIRVNDGGGRFFEPAGLRHFIAGFDIAI